MGICDSVPVPKQRIRKVGRQSSEVQENRYRTSRRINEKTVQNNKGYSNMIRGLLRDRISLQARKSCEMEGFVCF